MSGMRKIGRCGTLHWMKNDMRKKKKEKKGKKEKKRTKGITLPFASLSLPYPTHSC